MAAALHWAWAVDWARVAQSLLFIVAITTLFTLAYRGKGGGWKTWGVLSKRAGEPGYNPRHYLLRLGVSIKWASSSITSHGLSAACASLAAIMLGVHPLLAPFAAGSFLLFTKPDIGTGFAVIHRGFIAFMVDIHQQRTGWLRFLFIPADRAARAVMAWKPDHVRLGAWVWMALRLAFAAPFLLLLHYAGAFGGCVWATLLFSPMAATAYLLRDWFAPARDPVEVAELAMGPILTFATLAVAGLLLFQLLADALTPAAALAPSPVLFDLSASARA